MKKTVIYSILTGSLLMNMAFAYIIHDSVDRATKVIDENMELFNAFNSLENQYNALEKENNALEIRIEELTEENR